MPVRPLSFCVPILLLLVGCAREIYLDLPDETPKIVVISHFTPGEPFRAVVTLSQAVYDPAAPETPNSANVALSSEGEFVDRLRRRTNDAGDIYWESRDTPQVNVPYTLIVQIPGYESTEASSSAPIYVPLSPLTIDTENIRVEPLADNLAQLRIPLQLTIPAGPLDNPYFAFNLRHETAVYEDEEHEFLDYVFDGAARFLTDGVTFSLLHELDEPAVLVNEKYWTSGRRTLFLDALISFRPPFEKPVHLFVEWRTLSPEFYRYHLSLTRQGSNPPLNDPDAVYNNVAGGLGNFSGYTTKTDTIVLNF